MNRFKFFSLILVVFVEMGFMGCATTQEEIPDVEEAQSAIPADGVMRIPKHWLKSQLDDPSVVILDVRQVHNWDASAFKIKGAIREDPREVERWASNYPKDKAILLYGAEPLEATSAGVALQMMNMGFSTVYALKGGWLEWEKAKYPMEPK